MGSVFVSFDKDSVKDAIYVREYDLIYDNAIDRYFITKKPFFKYINKIFNSNEDISATILAKSNNGELLTLTHYIQIEFNKHGCILRQKEVSLMTAYENICFKIADLYRSDKILSYFKYDGTSKVCDHFLCKSYSFNGIKLFITCDLALFRDSIKIEIIYKERMFEEDNRGKLSDEDYNKVVDMLTGLLYSIGYQVLENV